MNSVFRTFIRMVPRAAEAIRSILDTRHRLAALQEEIAERQQAFDRLAVVQTRYRENIATLRATRGQAQEVRRLASELLAREAQLGEVERSLSEMRSRAAGLQTELNDRIGKAEF